jgi:2-polyprenyl-6-methoxyphenol hydroxylase-like FAD-dependent oxidoreductase
MSNSVAPQGSPGNIHDVAIVGYGPVGAALGILLAQFGHDVVILERHNGPYTLPRAVHFDGEVARIFQGCGIGEPLTGIIESAVGYEWRNATGDALLRIAPSADDGSGWAGGNMVHQPDLEALMNQRVAQLANLTVRRGLDVTAFTANDDGVTLTTSDGDVRARYVVGCDGANSTIRSLLDVDVTDLGFFYDWLICDLVLHHERVFSPANLQICDPARPTTVVSGGPGRRTIQGIVTSSEGTGRCDDVIGRGWRLLVRADTDRSTIDAATIDVAEIPDDLADWFTSIGGRIITVNTEANTADANTADADTADADIADNANIYGPWFDRLDCNAVLQRPDSFMYGSTSAMTPTELLMRLRSSFHSQSDA